MKFSFKWIKLDFSEESCFLSSCDLFSKTFINFLDSFNFSWTSSYLEFKIKFCLSSWFSNEIFHQKESGKFIMKISSLETKLNECRLATSNKYDWTCYYAEAEIKWHYWWTPTNWDEIEQTTHYLLIISTFVVSQ